MEFTLNPADEGFRLQVRRFIEDNLPAELAWRTRTGSYLGAHEDEQAWCRILAGRGWSVPHWPVELGGTGWTSIQHHIFAQENAKAWAPRPALAGPIMVGPVIIAVGSDAQKARLLPGIRSGETAWCQGFSEPGAGSDLASLRTTATRDGDHYIVTGQKLWTGGAHLAEWGFFLVRTDTAARAQSGISFLLIDMKSPGITVRPVHVIDRNYHTNEVFLHEVRVPAENIVGELNRGWQYAKSLLGNERTASAEIYWTAREIERTKALAIRPAPDGVRPIDTAEYQARIADLEIDLRALEYSVLRVLAQEETEAPGMAVISALKVRGSELMQRVSDLQFDLLGTKALRYIRHGDYRTADAYPDAVGWPIDVLGRTANALSLRAATIFGGSREIQKNIIAKAVFGL
jgi:alkylation response protein AidB-like acyl-CoA dehydrogenase